MRKQPHEAEAVAGEAHLERSLSLHRLFIIQRGHEHTRRGNWDTDTADMITAACIRC